MREDLFVDRLNGEIVDYRHEPSADTAACICHAECVFTANIERVSS